MPFSNDLHSIARRVGTAAQTTISMLAEMPFGGEALRSGLLSLDLAFGTGGVPAGCIGEIFGDEGSGKTTLALQLIAKAQQEGRVTEFVDAEYSLSAQRARALGVDISKLLVCRPACAEQALESVCEVAEESNGAFIVVDSVPALRCGIEMGISSDTNRLAHYLSTALPKLAMTMARTRSTLVFINQVREKAGILFGDPLTTPGGRALRHYCSFRLRLRRVAQIMQNHANNGPVIGVRCKLTVVKNKLAAPLAEAECDLLFASGFCRSTDLVNVGKNLGILVTEGARLRCLGKDFGSSADSAGTILGNCSELSLLIESVALKMGCPLELAVSQVAPAACRLCLAARSSHELVRRIPLGLRTSGPKAAGDRSSPRRSSAACSTIRKP